MKAAVPVAAIRQTWKCSGSVTVAQLLSLWHFCISFSDATRPLVRRHARLDAGGAGGRGEAALNL